MNKQYQNVLSEAYTASNARDTDKVLRLMHADVPRPNGWEGGYVKGQNEVREYWTR
jgi:hypothetical protein